MLLPNINEKAIGPFHESLCKDGFSCFLVVMATFFASKMASLLGDRLFEISGQGPPPQKDFFQLVITKNEVMYYLYNRLSRSNCIKRAYKNNPSI